MKMKIVMQAMLLSALLVSPVLAQEWSTPVRISEYGGYYFPDIIAVGDNLYVVYINESVGNDVYFVKSTDKGLTWANPISLSANNQWRKLPQIMYWNGNLLAIWHENQNVNFKYCISTDNGETWPEAQNVINSNWHGTYEFAASNAGPIVNLSLCDDQPSDSCFVYNVRSTDFGQSWSLPRRIYHPFRITNSCGQVSYGNYVHFVWKARFSDTGPYNLIYSRSTDSGLTWDDNVLLNNSRYINDETIAVDRFGNLAVSFAYGRQIFTRLSWDSGNNWGQIDSLTPDFGPPLYDLNIAFSNGAIFEAWESHDYHYRILFNKSLDGGINWDGEYWIDRNQALGARTPSIAVDKGNIYIVWYGGEYLDPASGIYYSYWPYYGTDAITDGQNNLPERVTLSAYPNPFNSSTTLSLDIAKDTEITIFDITGRLVKSLKAENGKAVWDAAGFSSGLYFAQFQAGDKTQTIKLILLK
jgi:hypothetical protein